MTRIAALQMQAVAGDVDANLAKIERAAQEAADAGASLLITPELALTGYGAGAAVLDLAEPAEGPLMARLTEIALAAGVAIVAGFAERADGVVWNSAAYAVGGTDPIVYRKSHLYGPYEKELFSAANPSRFLFSHDAARCGMLICYDVEFPENVRRLAQAGARLIVVPTALPDGDSGRFIADHMIRTRAFENQVFVAYVNHCGADGLFTYAGRSQIAAPDGTILAEADAEGEALLIADIEPDRFADSYATNTYLRDLRT